MQIEILKPRDGPTKTRRMLDVLKEGFANPLFNQFRMIVAFAKVGPLLRLRDSITKWRAAGKKAEAILGFDMLGTSKQALQHSLQLFNNSYLTSNNVPNCTFHPKIYLFNGSSDALAIVGSHNLTVGGLETNFEASVLMRMELPSEEETWLDALECWNQLLPKNHANTLPLNATLIEALEARGDLLIEGVTGSRVRIGRGVASRPPSPFPATPPKAPSSIKVPKVAALPKPKAKVAPPVGVAAPPTISPVQGLVIQIVPHHNGEIFLSKTAVNEHPEFFGAPFTGLTTPKKATNPPYPQREPDPSVELSLYDDDGELLEKHAIPNLNMVLYEEKGEIRITVSPSIGQKIDKFSILVMRQAPFGTGLDYTFEVFRPGSETYASYLSACNITLPSGGSSRARKMGWI